MLEIICRNTFVARASNWADAERKAIEWLQKYPSIQDHEVIIQTVH